MMRISRMSIPLSWGAAWLLTASAPTARAKQPVMVSVTANLPKAMEATGRERVTVVRVRNHTGKIVALERLRAKGPSLAWERTFDYRFPDRPLKRRSPQGNVLLPWGQRTFTIRLALRPGQHTFDLTLDYTTHGEAFLRKNFYNISRYGKHPKRMIHDLAYPREDYGDLQYQVRDVKKDRRRKQYQVSFRYGYRVKPHPLIERTRKAMKVDDYRTHYAHLGVAIRSGKKTYLRRARAWKHIGDVGLPTLDMIDERIVPSIKLYVRKPTRCLTRRFGARIRLEGDPTLGRSQRDSLLTHAALIQLGLDDLEVLWECLRLDKLVLATDGHDISAVPRADLEP